MNAPEAAGAGAPVVEKPKWEKQPIPRSSSFLQTALSTFTDPRSRGKYNKHIDAKFQCAVVLGPVEGLNKTCWLCGFPIQHLTSLVDPEGRDVFEMSTPMLDKATCEHVLPVKLAHAILELLFLGRSPEREALVHTEYEFAHNWCNIYKSDEYFVSLPLGSENLCNLEIKHEILDEILFRIFHWERGAEGSKQSSAVFTEYNGTRLRFKNIVQAYCFTSDPERFLGDRHEFYRNVWFPKTKALILQKLQRVIQHIRDADGCSGPSPGRFFAGIESRLRTGNPNLPPGLKNPSVARLKDEPLAIMRRLQRQSSYTNILAGTASRDRVIPFSAPPYDGYTLREPAPSPKPVRTRKSKKSNNENENVHNFREENLEPVRNALAAAGAGPGPVERGEVVKAVAEELAQDEIRTKQKKLRIRPYMRRTNLFNYATRGRYRNLLSGLPPRRGFLPKKTLKKRR